MEKIRLIIFREFWTRVRKKSFILTTVLAPLGFVLFFIAIFFISAYSMESRQRVVVLDESNFFKMKIPDGQGLYFFFQDTTLTYLEENYKEMGFDGILYIPEIRNLQFPAGIVYQSENQPGRQTISYIERRLSERLREVKVEQTNIDSEILKEIQAISVSVSPRVISAAGTREANTIVATAIGYIMGFVIYIVLFVYGTMLMKGVMEEKTNRIVEIIASSVKPFQLMMGKIIGIGLVGITQFVLWAVLITIANVFLSLAFSGSISSLDEIAGPSAAAEASGVNPDQVMETIAAVRDLPLLKIGLTFIFYFIGGYLLYGALFAAIGSATNDDGDLQSLTFPISIPIIISMVIMMSVVSAPDSPLAFWSSMIPLSSPIIMPARIAFGVPLWEVLLSMSFLIAGFVFTTWFASKVYRTGILMYGKKVTVRELFRWVWYR
ncbi:MAG: ABC transporter permease [Chitinophagaceae bacterium]|nr:MAG: ABC transporter permease [Chitinophagaceae bacterium]